MAYAPASNDSSTYGFAEDSNSVAAGADAPNNNELSMSQQARDEQQAEFYQNRKNDVGM